MSVPATKQDLEQPAPPKTRRRKWKWAIIALFVALVVPVLLFVMNGLVLSSAEQPQLRVLSTPAESLEGRFPATVKIFAFNIAKCFVYKPSKGFESISAVESRVRKIAELIRAEQPDFVFLSEAVTECGPCPVDQVASLAESTGMHAYAFGENYNFGLPFFRVVGGNAILSRFPIEPVANPDLAGRQPFYVTKNNRRVLWCATQIGGERVLLAAVHTDSFKRANNLKQTEQILEFVRDEAAILAGDFNARPDEPSIELVRRSGRFSGNFDGPQTYPSDIPDQRIDFIFAPAGWELVDERVIDDQVSDHRAVVATFRVPK